MHNALEITHPAEKARIAREVLDALPEWFGIEESKNEYVENSRSLPMWAVYDGEIPVGFIVLKPTSRHTAEIHVMDVKKEFHRTGMGRALYEVFENSAREMGFSYLQVKTVQIGKYPEYDMTNRFYMAMGFVEMECFPDMWDEANPCQIYIKYIG